MCIFETEIETETRKMVETNSFANLTIASIDVDSVMSFESFRALKLSNSESFRALKLSPFETFMVEKISWP